MNAIDQVLLRALGHVAHRSPIFDATVGTLVGLDLLKGGLFMAVLAWVWFATGPQRTHRREVVLATFVAAFASILVGRLLALLLPFRVRPLHDPAAALVVPYFAPEELLRGWSSFPSDHAMLFASLATGLWFIRPGLGILANVYALLVIDLPRVYFGWHYPTDLLAGFALGAAFAVLANLEAVRSRLQRRPMGWAEAHPSAFYAVACVAAIQVGTMCSDVRTVVHAGATVGRIALCKVRPHPGCFELGGQGGGTSSSVDAR